MSHPDPVFDPDNSYDDDYECDEGGFGFGRGGFAMRKDNKMDSNYDDHDDFYGEAMDYDDYNDDMDGDHDSAMTSAGWGTDEDYGYYGDPEDDNDYGFDDSTYLFDDREDFHSDDGYGVYDDGE